MDHPGATWYVVAMVKDQPVSPADGGRAMIDAGQLEVVELPEGAGRGDCSHCPASSFPCATRPKLVDHADRASPLTRNTLPRTVA